MLHELIELLFDTVLELVPPELVELVITEDELTELLDETFEDVFDDTSAPPAVALTVPDGELMMAVAAWEAT